jgi:phosphate-selective porin OprO and OprP
MILFLLFCSFFSRDILANQVIFENKDLDFKGHFRFRLQGRATYEKMKDETPSSPDKIDFMIRRSRLRLDGHILDPRLFYRLQLSFSRGDYDYNRTQYPHILRDAVIGWQLTEKSSLFFGQTKLPGNRQRVVSSGAQSFVDRSLVSATFNIDRDLGVQFQQQFFDKRPLIAKVAITNGEGRSSENDSTGMSYTARLEWQNFSNDSDAYEEEDFLIRQKAAFLVGLAYNLNDRTNQSSGQTGTPFPVNKARTLQSFFADILLKYQGYSFTAELAKRQTTKPIITTNSTVYVYKGMGHSFQLNKVWQDTKALQFWGVGLRASFLHPHQEIAYLEGRRQQYTFALNRYFKEHTIKLQADISYDLTRRTPIKNETVTFPFRLQAEIGI